MVGRSQLAAPISSAGVVLSQPTSSTTPSIGLPRIDSSTSIEARLRRQHRGRAEVRFAERHDRELDREAAGLEHAAPDVLRDASRKWALQGVSSDQVLQMPMTGRPSNTCDGMPWFLIQLRWMKPSLSFFPNHSAER